MRAGADTDVRPVSTVGSLESLLTRWFETELTPLLDKHRSLWDASLKRKIACLRDSVIAALETLLARRRRAWPFGVTLSVIADVRRLLDEGDDAIRRAREQAATWCEGRTVLAESIPRLVAERISQSAGVAAARRHRRSH